MNAEQVADQYFTDISNYNFLIPNNGSARINAEPDDLNTKINTKKGQTISQREDRSLLDLRSICPFSKLQVHRLNYLSLLEK